MVVVAAGPGGAHKVLLISSSSSSSSHSSDCNVAVPPVRKRQRLTHLSPEEKALRRKLKNRVAAQTARDRKKAKMGELELQVLELEHENQKLHLENQMLRERTSDLMSENEELRQRLGLDTLVRKEKVQVLESGASDLVLLNGSSESAALRLRVPPQQVQAQQSSKPKSSPWILTLLTLQTLSLISCLAFWTSLNQSCSSKKLRSRTLLSSSCWSDQRQVHYLPPHLELWGPHQLSWRPLMN